jgi:zinc protease
MALLSLSAVPFRTIPARLVRFSILICLLTATIASAADTPGGYAVVVSKSTDADPAWHKVVDTLVLKHGGTKFVYDKSVSQALPELQKQFPRYTCIVATAAEASRQLVADVNRLTRRYDDDPYADTFWGIVTGIDADSALAMAAEKTPLTIRKVAAGTEVELSACQEGRWFCELNAGKLVSKSKGADATVAKGPTDSTNQIVQTFNDYQPDLFVTSGHATERDWQIGYRYRNGQFRSKAGALFGVDTTGAKTAVQSPNPKVYLAVGNCLMGHIDAPDAMALAWMKSAGVRQMVGYTVLTWYGYNGWGMLDYFVEQPGRYTAAEAFRANQIALVDRLQTNFPDLAKLEPEPGKSARSAKVSDRAAKAGLKEQDGIGLLHDRDVVAFYGDPAWEARMADGPRAFEQTLSRDGDLCTLTIKPNKGAASFAAVNKNGAQRGGRPIVQFLDQRVKDVKIVEGAELSPIVGDDFVLVPNPGKCEAGKVYVVKFRAEMVQIRLP